MDLRKASILPRKALFGIKILINYRELSFFRFYANSRELSKKSGGWYQDRSPEFSFGEFVSLGTPYDPTLPDSLPRVLGASDERLTSEGSTSESFLDFLFRMLNGFVAGTT